MPSYSLFKTVDEHTRLFSSYVIVEGKSISAIIDQDGDALGLTSSDSLYQFQGKDEDALKRLNDKLIVGAQYKAYPVRKNEYNKKLYLEELDIIEEQSFDNLYAKAEKLNKETVRLFEQITGQFHESTIIDSVCFEVDED